MTYGLGPSHAHDTHRAYMRQGATLKSYEGFVCPKSHLVAQETSNDKFTITEPILPLASKWRVTHYPLITKKKKENKQMCYYELTLQTTKRI